MRQVPKILIIGKGNLANHWSHYLRLQKIEHNVWCRELQTDPRSLIKDATHIFLAISDNAISSFYQEYAKNSSNVWFHFSGSQYFEEILGLHPLQTFSDTTYSLSTYKKIPLYCDHPIEIYRKELTYLQNNLRFIPPEKKGLYHALCVVTGNFPLLIWQEAEGLIKDLNIQKQDLRPYLEQVLNNFLSDSKQYLSGPIYRQDKTTMTQNKSDLNKTNKNLQKIYEQLEKNFEV